jgi:hypothetical protein
MRRLYLLLLILLFALVSTSYGFPLNTTDGRIEIYGMVPTSDGFALDIYTPPDLGGTGLAPNLKVEIVDPDDIFIGSNNRVDISHPSYQDRELYFFKFDRPATQIKRMRIETPDEYVYSISWAGVPEASSQTIKLRLYGVTDDSGKDSYDYVNYKQYSFEVRITNNLSQGLVLSPDDFWLVDQFDYGYKLSAEEYKLLPNESVRYVLHSQKMSPISRPKYLAYMPDKLAMDLEGWY